MNRRTFLQGSLAGLAATATATAKPNKYRVGIIGHTGHGNYGHGLDTVWEAFDFVEVAAVADPDDAGRAKGLERTGARKAYADYHEMLEKEHLDIVAVGPRWLDQRVEMITAAADAGCHIFSEKPFAQDLVDADKMVAAIDRAGVKVQMAHQMRKSPFVERVREMVEAGEIGTIQEVRGRGKEDRRAGGEDLVVLGSHICDMLRYYLGDPKWVFAHVTDDGRDIAATDVRQASEPIGPIAGNEVAAMFAFDHGIHGYFGSKASPETHPWRFGTTIYGSKGVIYVPNAIYPGGQPYILRSAAWVPGKEGQWEDVKLTKPVGGNFKAEGRALANALLVEDLFQAIENDRKPVCSEIDGRWTVEMITSVYASQKAGARVDLPLKQRAHTLHTL
ncbi:MAG: Gfo/Idh/MocA family oxidoreductase [Acidobacteria bacterium]|nr:Gfo/Idh/MocA family oxidoreductase [Acidobacteriota bacterium]